MSLETNADNRQVTILRDFKRMIPVWIVVVATALIVVLSVRVAGIWHLRQTTYGDQNSCSYARVYYFAALQKISEIRELEAAVRLKEAQTDPAALDKAALGILKDNEVVDRARQDLRRAVEICPDYPEAYYTLSLVDWTHGDAAASYRNLGVYLRLTKHLPRAEAALEMALKEDASDPETLLQYALTEFLLGDPRRALEVVDQHEAALSDTPRGQLILGRLYVGVGRNEEGRETLEKGLRANASDRNAIIDYASVMTRLQKQREGADFLMSLGAGGMRTIPETYHNAATLYSAAGDLEKTAEAFRKAVELAPRNADLHFLLAVTLYKLGRTDEARDQGIIAFEHDPGAVMRGVQQSGIDPRKAP